MVNEGSCNVPRMGAGCALAYAEYYIHCFMGIGGKDYDWDDH
jgi:hypothetical protein